MLINNLTRYIKNEVLMKNANNGRSSNIELLRCLLMFYVVVIHFVGHNILSKDAPAQIGDMNYFSSNLLLSISVCAVDCFVLISGYFTIKLTFKKIVLFLLPIFFYEIVISLVFFPFSHHFVLPKLAYWFVRPYLALMLFSPIINYGLQKLSGTAIRNLLIISILFFVLPPNSPTGNSGKNIYIFILLYITGYYIRNYYQTKKNWGGYFLCYLLSVIFIMFETIFLHKKGLNSGVSSLSYNYDNILIYFAAITLFLSFTKLNLHSKIINWVASSSFYVYIISENPNMYRGQYNIYNLLGVESWSDSSAYVFYVLGMSVVIFSTAILIDKVRIVLFSRFETKIGNWADKKNLDLTK